MARYTQELREVMTHETLFDFEYELFDPLYKPVLEKHIYDHFFFREIGQETVDRFKHVFKSKFLIVIPIYNKYYTADRLEQRILDNYDVTETFNKTVSSDTTSEGIGKNIFADTPQGNLSITDGFASNINETTDSNTIGNDGTETWERKMTGNIGIQTDADAVVKYWETLINVDLMLINELEECFMGVF